MGSTAHTSNKETYEARSAGCSIRVAIGNLRSLPFGPTRHRPWMRRLQPERAEVRPHVAVNGVALTARNSHQINPHLPSKNPGRAAHGDREQSLAKEWFGSNRLLQRTIATSRSDGNRDDLIKQRRRPREIHGTRPEKRRRATVAQNPMEKPLQLDKLFQERSMGPQQFGAEVNDVADVQAHSN